MLENRAEHLETLHAVYTKVYKRMPKRPSSAARGEKYGYLPPPPMTHPFFLEISKRCNIPPPPSGTIFLGKTGRTEKNSHFASESPPGQTPSYITHFTKKNGFRTCAQRGARRTSRGF